MSFFFIMMEVTGKGRAYFSLFQYFYWSIIIPTLVKIPNFLYTSKTKAYIGFYMRKYGIPSKAPLLWKGHIQESTSACSQMQNLRNRLHKSK